MAGGKWASVDISQGPETQDEELEHTEGGAAHEATWLRGAQAKTCRILWKDSKLTGSLWKESKLSAVMAIASRSLRAMGLLVQPVPPQCHPFFQLAAAEMELLKGDKLEG